MSQQHLFAEFLTEVDNDRNTWATPPALFAQLHQEFKFTVDACAHAWNAKLPYYWSPAQDGLMQSWQGHTVWCNPPYGKGLIEPWVRKALTRQADTAVLLVPSRTDTDWFQACLSAKVEQRFLPKRVHFVPPPGVEASSPTEASVLIIVRKA
jgi:phage N-6-adenine-methyltransferase